MVRLFIFLLGSTVLATPPSWLKNKPTSDDYYIGIAKVIKANHPSDYQEVAINTALSFLSSEISVSVDSKTQQISKDTNGFIANYFEEHTKIKTKEKIEGYEIFDTWESRKEYAVYCRLSKKTYLDSKRKVFLGALNLLRERYNSYQNFKDQRNLGNALRLANQLERETKKLVARGDVLPYMTNSEFRDIQKYMSSKDHVLGNLHILVKTKELHPFIWYGAENIKLSLIDTESEEPWNNFTATLEDAKGNELHLYENQKDFVMDFPVTMYASSLNDLNFKLNIISKNKTTQELVRSINFSIPIETGVKIGKIHYKGIKKSTEDVGGLISMFLVNFEQENTHNIQKIDVSVKFKKKYTSSGWITGDLVLGFKNASITSRQTGEGKISVSCSGNTMQQAIINGVDELRKLYNEQKINWK